MRICVVCGEEIPKDKRVDALYCSKECGNKARGKKFKHLNKEKVQLQNYIYNSDVQRRIFIRAKSRAKLSDIPFNLDLEDIVVPEFCPVLGLKLEPRLNKKGFHPSSPSLDKIIPELGYVKGNVRVISARANLLKNDATIEELEKVLNDLKKILE